MTMPMARASLPSSPTSGETAAPTPNCTAPEQGRGRAGRLAVPGQRERRGVRQRQPGGEQHRPERQRDSEQSTGAGGGQHDQHRAGQHAAGGRGQQDRGR